MSRSGRLQLIAVVAAGLRAGLVRAADPLPSWNDGPTKQSILDFVAKVTKEGGPDFVRVSERIATFDNDGTLWCEHPMYVQLAFALDRVKTSVDDLLLMAAGADHLDDLPGGPLGVHRQQRQAGAEREPGELLPGLPGETGLQVGAAAHQPRHHGGDRHRATPEFGPQPLRESDGSVAR